MKKENDERKNELNIEIKGTDMVPIGSSIDINLIDKESLNKYIDISKPYIKDAFILLNININFSNSYTFEQRKRGIENCLEKIKDPFKGIYLRKITEETAFFDIIIQGNDLRKNYYKIIESFSTKVKQFSLILKTNLIIDNIFNSSDEEILLNILKCHLIVKAKFNDLENDLFELFGGKFKIFSNNLKLEFDPNALNNSYFSKYFGKKKIRRIL